MCLRHYIEWCLLDHRYAFKIKYVHNVHTLHKNTTNSSSVCSISHTKTQKISGLVFYSHHYFFLIWLVTGEIVLLENKLYLTFKFFEIFLDPHTVVFFAIFALVHLFNQSLSFTSRLLTAVCVSMIPLF